jgi:hypothetical protein
MNQLAHYRNLLEAIDTNTAWMKNVKAQGGKLSVITKPNVPIIANGSIATIGYNSIIDNGSPLTITEIEIPLDPTWSGTVGIYFNSAADKKRYGDSILGLIYEGFDDDSWAKIDQLIARSIGVHDSVLMHHLMDVDPLRGDGVGIRVYIDPDLVRNAIDQIFRFNKELTRYAIVNDFDLIRQLPDPNPELFDDPEIKRAIIVGTLQNIKTGNNIEARAMISYLTKQGVNWPEIAGISRSVNASLKQ